VGKGFSKSRVLSSLLSLSLVDMLHVTNGSFSTYGSITSLQLTSLGLFFAYFVFAPCFLFIFLTLFWVLF
jgi:Sec-independent protein secretion pathway component TatC